MVAEVIQLSDMWRRGLRVVAFRFHQRKQIMVALKNDAGVYNKTLLRSIQGFQQDARGEKTEKKKSVPVYISVTLVSYQERKQDGTVVVFYDVDYTSQRNSDNMSVLPGSVSVIFTNDDTTA